MNSTRFLLSLFIVLTCLPLTVSVLEASSSLNIDYREVSDEIAMYRLRRIYLLSYEREISDECISFQYQERQFELACVNNKLILSPGTQIFIDGVDELYFKEEGELVSVCYSRKGKNYEKVLGKKERLCLDDFSFGDDVCDESVDGDSLSDEDVPEGTGRGE